MILDDFYTKHGKVRKLVECRMCKKKKLKLVRRISAGYISGDMCYYMCSCGHEEKKIL